MEVNYLASRQHLILLKRGAAAWNAWRETHQDIQPDFAEADLTEANLRGADLTGARLIGHRGNLFTAVSVCLARQQQKYHDTLHLANLKCPFPIP